MRQIGTHISHLALWLNRIPPVAKVPGSSPRFSYRYCLENYSVLLQKLSFEDACSFIFLSQPEEEWLQQKSFLLCAWQMPSKLIHQVSPGPHQAFLACLRSLPLNWSLLLPYLIPSWNSSSKQGGSPTNENYMVFNMSVTPRPQSLIHLARTPVWVNWVFGCPPPISCNNQWGTGLRLTGDWPLLLPLLPVTMKGPGVKQSGHSCLYTLLKDSGLGDEYSLPSGIGKRMMIPHVMERNGESV